MKPMNFPARKLRRQLEAKYGLRLVTLAQQDELAIAEARNIRTKKDRRNRATVR